MKALPKQFPALDELYNDKTGVTPFRIGNSEIFVNFNRHMKPFIRVNNYPSKTKTFAFTENGYASAIKWLLEAEKGESV